MNIYEKLSSIQNELKVPKGQTNNFGHYNYRSCEDILEASKKICKKHKTVLLLSDTPVIIGERNYIEATATLYDLEEDKSVVATASARESLTKKGMDESQITGTASSYARKYALNGLFNIDDTKDADTDEYRKTTQIKSNNSTEEPKATSEQIMMFSILLADNNKKIEDVLNHYKLNKLEDMSKDLISNLISKMSK